MQTVSDRQYGEITVRNIISDKPENWDASEATHVRVSLPSDVSFHQQMQQMGYQFVERMLDVSINLRRTSIDFQKSIRIEPIVTAEYKSEIKQIAEHSFTRDRRFHVDVVYNPVIAKQIMDAWIEDIPEFYVCLYKEILIGFLALKEAADGKSASIYLAAVEERYRASGAAMSLYANAVKVGQEKGYQNITGYISSTNVAVMNLYASLGGTFSNPQDIFLKK